MSTEKLGNLIYSQPKKEREVVRVMNKWWNRSNRNKRQKEKTDRKDRKKRQIEKKERKDR